MASVNRHNFAVEKLTNQKNMKLKQMFLIAVMSLMTFVASAQIRTSVRAGVTATTFGDQEIKLGMRAGANVEYHFTNLWGIRSGLFYTMKGATTSKNVFCYDPQKTTKLSYLDIPFEAQVSFGLSEKTSMSIHAGPYLAYLVHSSVPKTVDYTIRRMELGAGFGLDLTIGHFVITPEVQYGLTTVTNPGSNHNISYALTFGYRF